MLTVQSVLDRQCTQGAVPGVVAVASKPGVVEFASAGVREIAGTAMARDTVFRLASLTKPILAAATMALVDRNELRLEDEVTHWMPELADRRVLRTPDSPLDDVVPADREITVYDLLTGQHGIGFPVAGGQAVMELLTTRLLQGSWRLQDVPPPQEWLRRLAELPLLHQPGRGWSYNTGYDILGILISRCRDSSLERVLTDTILGPLRMWDTRFHVPSESLPRFATLYRRVGEELAIVDEPAGQWASDPPFQSGAGGLVGTLSDWHTFALMLLAQGRHDGRQVLSAKAVTAMTTPHVRSLPDNPFLQGQAWGFGGAVDVVESHPWCRVGRYGWVGGTGTAGYIDPARKVAKVWFSQVVLDGPEAAQPMGDFLAAPLP